MANNVTIPATGSGDATPVVATDALGGSTHHQLVKNEWGASGTATQTTNTAAAAFPIASIGRGTNASGQTTVTNSSTSIIAAREGRQGVLLVNQQTVAVYIDPSGGTATTSKFRLDPGASMVCPVTTAITGITSAAYSASGDAKVHYAEYY